MIYLLKDTDHCTELKLEQINQYYSLLTITEDSDIYTEFAISKIQVEELIESLLSVYTKMK